MPVTRLPRWTQRKIRAVPPTMNGTDVLDGLPVTRIFVSLRGKTPNHLTSQRCTAAFGRRHHGFVNPTDAVHAMVKLTGPVHCVEDGLGTKFAEAAVEFEQLLPQVEHGLQLVPLHIA